MNMNSKTKSLRVEYIWLDGSRPQKLRSKTKIIHYSLMDGVEIDILDESQLKLPDWNYDGSSTGQAETNNSEIVLKPRTRFYDPFGGDLLVMCDTYNVDGNPIETNHRYELEQVMHKDKDTWYGFEQEYIMFNNEYHTILGWPTTQHNYPAPQGDYYCGVGAKYVNGVSDKNIAREIAMYHLECCREAGISISGVNAEVMLGQWEYQVGPVTALEGSDQLWMSRYILYRIGEIYNVEMNIDPKPIRSTNWNGSGMHVNFSTNEMRDPENIKSGKTIELIEEACMKLKENHERHIEKYGENNEHRLTGHNETASFKEFKWGYGDRTASIRVPFAVKERKAGYLEDRRPGSNANPYIVVRELINTIL